MYSSQPVHPSRSHLMFGMILCFVVSGLILLVFGHK
jgi:hypothetical protein